MTVSKSVPTPARARSIWWAITARPGAVKRTAVAGTAAASRNKNAATARPVMTMVRTAVSLPEVVAVSGPRCTRTMDAGFTFPTGFGARTGSAGRTCFRRCLTRFVTTRGDTRVGLGV